MRFERRRGGLVRTSAGLLLVILGSSAGTRFPQDPGTEPSTSRFEAVDVFVDPGRVPFAAFQFELVARGGVARLVGVENGEHPAFDAPHYDPRALLSGRVIIAALHVGEELPSGRTRVATLHFEVSDGVTFEGTLIALVSPEGDRIPGRIECVR